MSDPTCVIAWQDGVCAEDGKQETNVEVKLRLTQSHLLH